jgi:glycosyltransferase involved in cell wall biosynthesis
VTPTGRPVLLTVSGTIPADLDDQIREGLRPRADYRIMADHFDADVIDADQAAAHLGRVGRLVRRFVGVGAVIALYCFRMRRRYDVIVTDGEQVGIPLAFLGRVFGCGTARHLMIVHILSAPKKATLIRVARLASRIDHYAVYCSAQQRFIESELGVPSDRILLTPFMVDTEFFDAMNGVESKLPSQPPRSMICSAGLERRDYDTLIAAVEGLDVDVVIAAASPWSKREDSTQGRRLPANVDIRKLNLFELRQLYAESTFVVMPLDDVDFQAGITTILEAMSMAKPLVCTRTPGQTDTIVEGETGRYVPIGDVDALRNVIEELLHDAAQVARLGTNAREWAVAHAEVDRYAQRLADLVGMLRASER